MFQRCASVLLRVFFSSSFCYLFHTKYIHSANSCHYTAIWVTWGPFVVVRHGYLVTAGYELSKRVIVSNMIIVVFIIALLFCLDIVKRTAHYITLAWERKQHFSHSASVWMRKELTHSINAVVNRSGRKSIHERFTFVKYTHRNLHLWFECCAQWKQQHSEAVRGYFMFLSLAPWICISVCVYAFHAIILNALIN